MAMTIEGGKTIVRTMTDKHGSYEEYCQWMRTIASKGGKKTGMKGFALDRERAREAGRKGGTLSRRNRK
jgi:general stress protein YciG